MTKQSDLAAALTKVSDQLTKASTEIQSEIQTLKDQLANGEISAEAQASLDRLTDLSQKLDDLNPDVPTDGGGDPAPAPETPPTE